MKKRSAMTSKMEDIRQILLRNPELPHEENLHYLYQYNFLNNNLTPSSKMENIHFQNLNLDPEELHYLCQETNRPTLGVTWNYLELVYFNSFIREQPKQNYNYKSIYLYIYRNMYLCIHHLSTYLFSNLSIYLSTIINQFICISI